MIKMLQKKFMITIMLVVSILLIGMILAFFSVTYYLQQRENTKILDYLTTESSPPHRDDLPETDNLPKEPPQNDFKPKNPPQKKDRPDPFFSHSKEKVQSSNFFRVRFSTSGNILETDLNQMPALKQDDAEKIAQTIYDTWKKDNISDGSFQHFKFRIQKENQQTISIFILDTTLQFYSRILMLIAAILAAIICWLLMLLISLFLSKLAIRPIAENIERQKQFITNAGHEIKTPLAIISANTEAMELHLGKNKWNKNIREQVTRLTGLTQNLLTLARMEEQSELICSTFSFSQLIESVLQPFFESTALRGIFIETDIIPDIMFYANEEHIRQLLSILLDNASKYTNSNGQIFVRLLQNGKQITLTIKNTCDKLPDVNADKLFERFFRGDSARTQKNGGYGIGLSVAKAIVTLYHGQIQVLYDEPPAITFQITFSNTLYKKNHI